MAVDGLARPAPGKLTRGQPKPERDNPGPGGLFRRRWRPGGARARPCRGRGPARTWRRDGRDRLSGSYVRAHSCRLPPIPQHHRVPPVYRVVGIARATRALLRSTAMDPHERATSVWYRVAGLLRRKGLAIEIIEAEIRSAQHEVW